MSLVAHIVEMYRKGRWSKDLARAAARDRDVAHEVEVKLSPDTPTTVAEHTDAIKKRAQERHQSLTQLAERGDKRAKEQLARLRRVKARAQRGEKEFEKAVLRSDAPRVTETGPRGGKYYLNLDGQRVYVKD